MLISQIPRKIDKVRGGVGGRGAAIEAKGRVVLTASRVAAAWRRRAAKRVGVEGCG